MMISNHALLKDLTHLSYMTEAHLPKSNLINSQRKKLRDTKLAYPQRHIVRINRFAEQWKISKGSNPGW